MRVFDIDTIPDGAAPCVVQDFDGVRLIRLNEPRRRNALTLALRAALADILDKTLDRDDIRAIVLAGSGPVFCAGGDITSMTELDAVSGRPRLQRVHRLFRQLYEGPKPVIAAVEGKAVGAGLSLATACDLIVAGEESHFGAPFNRVGVMPDLGLLFTLPARIGLGRTKLMAFTGDLVDAATAEAWGLADMVTSAGDALNEALTLATRIASGAPLAHTMTKQMLARLPLPSETFLAAEADAQALLFSTVDFSEGRDAFLAKREPNFSGR